MAKQEQITLVIKLNILGEISHKLFLRNANIFIVLELHLLYEFNML